MLPPFNERNVRFAYQLRYLFGCHTYKRQRFFHDNTSQVALLESLKSTCEKSNYHLLEQTVEPDSLQLLVSLSPTDSPAKAIQTIKSNTSRLWNAQQELMRSESSQNRIWGRGYFCRSVGTVSLDTITNYVARQRERHVSSTRLLSEYVHPDEAAILDTRTFAHACAQYNLHVVLCPVGHVAAIDAKFARPLSSYFLQVARKKDFAIARAAILADHVHLLISAPPRLSPAFIGLTLMNNSSHWFAATNPGAFNVWDIPGFWAPSAFVGTVGNVTTTHIRNYLRGKERRGGGL